MKKRFAFLILAFCLISFFVVSPFSVNAADEEEEEKGVYCPLCNHRNDKDPLYNKERQFYTKISIIKKAFGDCIDEIVLAASVLHRYTGADLAYEEEYDENFDSSEYSKRLNALKSLYNASSLDSLSGEEKELVKDPSKYDLLSISALVMMDSSKNGTYSDVCFKSGLSGDSIVGTQSTESEIRMIREVTCNSVASLGTSSYNMTAADYRAKNLNLVCNNGYVGGLYNGAYSAKEGKRKKYLKRSYAQQIIDYANYYKKLYGKSDEESVCVKNSAGNSGLYSTWKQADNKWSKIVIGDESDETLGKYGCLVTSLAIQISRSGTQLGSLPNGAEEFDPGSFAKSLKENNGFDHAGNFKGIGYDKIAPKLKILGTESVKIKDDDKELYKLLSGILKDGVDGKYQKFILLRLKYKTPNSSSSQHWVAVNKVENNKVTIYDPAFSGTSLSNNYSSWTVTGYMVIYMEDVEVGKSGPNGANSCGNDLNRFIAFIGNNESGEEPAMCNFQGRGEGTGYLPITDPRDPGGTTTAFGITIYNEEIANSIGYTTFRSELYGGCTEKASTEQLLVAIIEDGREDMLKRSEVHSPGVTYTDNELYALMSISYGGNNLVEPVMEAIKAYGKESEEVYRAFQNSFSRTVGGGVYVHGHMRRRMTEFEIFRSGNYEAESTQYLGWDNIFGKASAMSMTEAMSHWPSRRDTLLEGYDFAPINGKSVGKTSSGKTKKDEDCNLICKDGQPVCGEEEEEDSSESVPIVCGKSSGTTNILFVGNSRTFAEDIPGKFKKLVSSKKKKVNVTTAMEGGQTLLALSGQFSSTISRNYDCVIMQEQTETYLYDYDTFLSGAKSVVNKVKDANSSVKTYVRQTWGKNNSDRAELDTAYSSAEKVASSTGSHIIADGKAFEQVASTDPAIPLFSDDRHQTAEGAYLSAACIYDTLYDAKSLGASYDAGLGKEKAKKLQTAADAVCKAPRTGGACATNSTDYKSSEYQRRLSNLPNYNQASGVAANLNVDGARFANVGCGGASLMGAYYMYTGDDSFDYVKFVNDMVEQGYLDSSGGNSYMFYEPTGTPIMTDRWGLSGYRIDYDYNQIIDALKSGKKVIFNIGVNGNTNFPTSYGHYVLFDHYKEDTDEIYMFEPGNNYKTKYWKVDYLKSQLVLGINDPVVIEMNGHNSSKCNSSRESSGIAQCVREQLGKPYIWATHGPDSFDCSGLSCYCYGQNGIELSCGSYDQLEDPRFTNVSSESEMSPGDLLVYSSGGHVGIYVGDGKVIHAPQPGAVVTEVNFSSFGWGNSVVYRHYVG